MKLDMVDDVQRFHEHFDLPYTGEPRELTPLLMQFRLRFMNEEFNELQRAIIEEGYPDAGLGPTAYTAALNKARAGQLDAICDLIYVMLGYAYLRGWDVKEGWRRVHAANMTKERAGVLDPRARSPWDVVKPPGFIPPDLTDLVEIPNPIDRR